jgi:Rrf2 family protein
MVAQEGRPTILWQSAKAALPMADNACMRVSAKADYAVRAAAELAAAGEGRHLKRDQIAEAQKIPSKFLETIMLDLKHTGIVKSTRGAEGGYALARPAADISLADVIRAVDGPMATVRGERVESVEYEGAARALREVWVAVRASLRGVLELTSLQDLIDGELPERVRELTSMPEAYTSLNRVRGSRA